MQNIDSDMKTPKVKNPEFIKSKYQNYEENQQPKINQISPLRNKNLAANDISKLSTVNEENISKELTPSRARAIIKEERMSPMRSYDSQIKYEHFSPVPFEQRSKHRYENHRPPSSERNPKYSSPGLNVDNEVLPDFEEFQRIMKDIKANSEQKEEIKEIESTPYQQNKRADIEYQSIQETLKSIRDMRGSYSGSKAKHGTRGSHQDIDLDYSLTSSHFSRDDNPIEDGTEVFNSVEKFGGEDTISVFTYKSPDGDTLRDTLRESWKRSSGTNAFLIFKDRSILELIPVYDKVRSLDKKPKEIEQSLEKVEYLLNRLRYLNNKKSQKSPIRSKLFVN